MSSSMDRNRRITAFNHELQEVAGVLKELAGKHLEAENVSVCKVDIAGAYKHVCVEWEGVRLTCTLEMKGLAV